MKQVYIGDYHKRQLRKASAQTGVVDTSVATDTLDDDRNKRIVNHARFFSPAHLATGAHNKKQVTEARPTRIREITRTTVRK
ncbi:hypothetical protein [Microscilla marina]|uniref:Uncharacterized protein n=1 Tax=Microscilla marina ATCC 23134 TaxID=313606 RepID=A1ZNH4_MICM2|nr:hypothetical protein [Microscilla marina]EAY28085.1 hypothetical protein M23134_02195 [Microscilla marina ATCC 23134]